MALESSKGQTSITEELKSILRDPTNIKLCWIKAHIGIKGNEAADSLAKEATKKGYVDTNIRFSKKWLKNNLQKHILCCQSRWENSGKARYAFWYFFLKSLWTAALEISS
ncbi:hypothetical protein AVEN_112902-1 [Araneus ventricosus]|uniref:RNase H type-1 domain-containing protein n=1 Tax=Araneus ventricosus TaxID=182803 RepID=A0A4Y2W1G8_ARAVE|nr:hypothetical protein AVEN_112902-1 [Araneus ventricosus]